MIALRLKSQSVHVAAPRGLVFEVVSSAGKKTDQQDDEVVEFESRWAGHVFKTLERVTLEPPDRIIYRWLTGPVLGVEEEIRFEDLDGQTTRMSYRGSFRPPANLLGWVRAVTVIRPIFNKLVVAHLDQGKRLAEARFIRSRLYKKE